MSHDKPIRPETLLAQAMGWVDQTTSALIPPIYNSVTYERGVDNSYAKGFIYSRNSNPNSIQIEKLLTKLEMGEDAMVVGSGMSAATIPFMTLKRGDHVVVQSVMYWAIRKWLIGFADQWGLLVDFFDPSDLNNLRKLIRPGETKLVWIESPANPVFSCVDILEAAQITHDANARLCVDSTIATPILTRPIELGADLVMHSATKYLNGHSDVTAGALITASDDEWWKKMREIRTFHGKILSPNDTWLLLRGLRTLHLRVNQSCNNAMDIARHFESYREVKEVLYPGLKSSSTHEIAKKQMKNGFGGMLSMRFVGGERKAIDIAANLKVFKRATSLGGVESLVEHRASIEGEGTTVSSDLLRFSVGIEHIDDLVEDLEQAIC
jgi:cystathionine gamma-synthase